MEPSSTAARALRESFGDRKPIDISRKITACVNCRKLKIKCQMSGSAPPCNRCQKRGLSCVVNRSLQMLLESDVTWKTNVEQKLLMLEDSIKMMSRERVCSTNEAVATPRSSNNLTSSGLHGASTFDIPSEGREQGWEVVMDMNKEPGVIPASVVSEVAHATPTAARNSPASELDIVDRGIITLAEAETFFALYHGRLDHFIYKILSEHESLSSVRKSSAVLTAAVCAVGALHEPSNRYQACYQHFVEVASSHMFSKRNSHDDVRAFCIGAFWLSDISWNLLGIAARLAGELNLHRCIPKAPHTKKACYLRTRLYYLVYICDHHFSIVYGRPPLTRDFSSVTPPSEFLRSEFATEDDVRLVSQLEIWIINTRIFDQFSLDPEAHLSDRMIPQLRRLSIALDTWRVDWADKLQFHGVLGHYPPKGIGLYYHFAKLFLCSHVFRKAPVVGGELLQLDPELKEFASIAIHAATSILQTIITDEEVRAYFHGLPAYFDTMIAFAFVFLLRVTIKDLTNVWIDRTGVSETLNKLVIALQDITASMHPRHLLTSIASSMRKLLDRSVQFEGRDTESQVLPSSLSGPPAASTSTIFVSPTDTLFLEQFDFLNSPDACFNFDTDFWTTPQPRPGTIRARGHVPHQVDVTLDLTREVVEGERAMISV